MIPSIQLQGTATAMGHQHGEEFREEIEELSESRIEFLNRLFGKGSIHLIEESSKKMERAIQDLTPRVYEETVATAKSARLDYWRLIVAGACSDVADCVSRLIPGTRNVNGGCTLAVLNSDDSKDGLRLIGTWDTQAFATAGLALCRRDPVGEPSTLALTTFGWPMQQGVTSAGLGFAIANLVATSTGDGVPYMAALMAGCTQISLNRMVSKIDSLPHASARYYQLLSRDRAVGIEMSPHGGNVQSDDDAITHTNHFILDGARSWEGREPLLRDSKARLGAIRGLRPHLLSAGLDADLIKAFLDSSVIQQGSFDEDRTGAVFLLNPSAREMSFVGYPNSPEESIALNVKID